MMEKKVVESIFVHLLGWNWCANGRNKIMWCMNEVLELDQISYFRNRCVVSNVLLVLLLIERFQQSFTLPSGDNAGFSEDRLV